MNAFNFFEKIYCINMDSRLDRWQNCLKNFEDYQITNYERISGVEILEKDFQNLDQKSRSQLGCALSFYRIIKNSYNNNYKSVLIFEDDFYFNNNLEKTLEVLENSIKDLPEEWDIFYLGANVMYDFSNNPMSSFKEYLFKLNSAYCTHSISFSKKGIELIMNKFPEEIIFINEMISNYQAIDIFLSKDFCLNNFCFIPNEMICLQYPSFSSIEDAYCDYSYELLQKFENTKALLVG
jgi:GR25 family glycosyltransferase involved in LPS biosynthesis